MPSPVQDWPTLLNSFLGKDIKNICKNGYDDKTFNHCAHFVSHVLGLEFGYTCKLAVPRADAAGACLRVHEVFARCPMVGKFDDSKNAGAYLVFVTAPGNVNMATKTMSNVPKKHIGVHFNGTIWHYSNSQDKVVTEAPARFVKHYPTQTNVLFYGTFPVQ